MYSLPEQAFFGCANPCHVPSGFRTNVNVHAGVECLAVCAPSPVFFKDAIFPKLDGQADMLGVQEASHQKGWTRACTLWFVMHAVI